MNTLHLVKFPQLLSIATLMIGVSSVSVGAETVNPASPKTNPIPLPGTALTTAAPLMGAPIAIESLPAAQTDETTTTESAKSVPSSPDSLAGLETAASDSTDSVQEPALLTQAQPAAQSKRLLLRKLHQELPRSKPRQEPLVPSKPHRRFRLLS